MRQWHVLYVKPHKELLVYQQLEAKDIEAYFPYTQIERGYHRGIRVEPFFPHYLFFRADLHTNEANGLRWMPGVRSIVHSENGPSVVPDAIIEALRKRLDPFAEVVYERAHLFSPGQELTIEGGLFDGFEAIFQHGLTGRDRAQVLLKLLGGWTKAELSYKHLKPYNQAPVLAG
jgi:transcriptional antiterminator RfaH